MSYFFIPYIAIMTLFDFSGSGSFNISSAMAGAICYDTPYLSFSQPHWFFSPSTDSFSQSESISSWVSHLTYRDIASQNPELAKIDPPFRA